MKSTDNKDFSSVGLELVLVMARALVNHPEQVEVRVQKGENTTVFFLTVAPGELGQVLGKQGSIAAALRKILFGFACRSNHRAVLEIVDSAAPQEFSKSAA